jgi:hypothetical protein
MGQRKKSMWFSTKIAIFDVLEEKKSLDSQQQNN